MAETSPKHSDAAVALLRANLGFFSSQIPADLESYLLSLLEKAFADFAEMNIHLHPGELSDDFDQVTYAAWLYRNGTAGAGKTDALKNVIRNRQVGQATKSGEVSA